MQDAKEEIRSRLNIEDVIGEYVQLRRAGRNLKGLSPFTDERTPSFMVSPEKQIWHDFSSGKGGDIYTFVMLMEGLDFRGSLEYLARKAGVDLSLFSHGDGQSSKRRARAREALGLAAKFYQQNLINNSQAQEYVVKKRQLSRQTISDFVVGYAPDAGGVAAALGKRGFTRQELADAGLINRFGGDLFKGRMMVAFQDGSGEVIGFTGRIITENPRAPKYLNTPQTLLFDKSRYIFGLFQAKEAIRKNDEAVIVEGNLDVVSSHQAGVRQVVATSGTAVTEQHLKALSRLAGRVKLAFDRDKAGLAATERAISLAQSVGVELEVVTLSAGAKDPDELIKSSGVSAWKAAIAASQPAVDWVIDTYSKRENLATAEGKRRFSSAALELVRRLRDPVEQEHYLTEISHLTGASLTALRAKMSSGNAKKTTLKRSKFSKEVAVAPQDDSVDLMLGLAASAPALRRWLPLLNLTLLPEDAARFASFLVKNQASNLTPVPLDLQKIEQYVKIVQLKSESRYTNWEPETLDKEMERLVRNVIAKHRETRKKQLLQELRSAEASADDSLSERLRRELNQLIKEK